MKGVARVRRVARILHTLVKPAAVILMYHRIADLAHDPFHLAVSPSHFAQHLALVSETCHPIRLADLADAISQDAVPRRAVAITFDDGYADNYHPARLLLESAKVPATVFVTTGKTDSPAGFWWDELCRIFMESTCLPERLSLSVQGCSYEWSTKSEEERWHVMGNVRDLIRRRPITERERIIDDLQRWAGPQQSGSSVGRAMTTDELIGLSQSDYLDVGAHTISHPVLSSLSCGEQQGEINGSRQRLQAILGKPISAFAYPYGNPEDFTDESVAAVRDAGFRCAVTTTQGNVQAGDDLFCLRRWEVNDWGLEEFRHRLENGFIA